MKRVKVSPGKFVVVSTAMAEKAVRVFATGALTRDQVRTMAASEPTRAGLLIGGPSKSKTSGKRVTTVAGKKLPGAGGVVVHGRDGRIVSGGNPRPKRKAA